MVKKDSLKELKEKFKNAKLIVSDVDGTLVNNSGSVSNRTKDTVQELKERKVLFSLASQRVFSSIQPLAMELGITIPVIASNGALLQDAAGKCIFRSTIKPSKVKKALKLADQFYVKIALCYNDVIVYTDENSVLKDFMHRFGTTYTLVEDYNEYTDNVLEIIMSGNDKPTIKKIRRKMKFPFGLHLSARYFRSFSHKGVYNLEVSRAGINKKTALTTLANHLGIKKEQVFVFGDWYNDRDLFDFGGVNIAMANSVPELKNQACYITESSNEDDGLCKFLETMMDG